LKQARTSSSNTSQEDPKQYAQSSSHTSGTKNLAEEVQTARFRLDKARLQCSELARARAIASLAADDANNTERQARDRVTVAAKAEDASRENLAQAQVAEQEARRKREEVELAHNQAAEEQATALRAAESAGHILTVVNEALENADVKLRDAEQEENAAEAALVALAQQTGSNSAPTPAASDGSPSDTNPNSNQKSAPSKPTSDPPTVDPESEEKQRQAALAESIRKMNEMRRQEEFDATRRKMEQMNAREQQRQADLRAAEAEARADRERREREREEEQRRERQEAERKEREEVYKLEKERLEALWREQAWREATKRENLRCSTRDLERWPRNRRWTVQDALDRFQLLNEEFDALKFSNDMPLTVASVPWPVLCVPYDLVIKIHIEWKAVESFFLVIRTLLTPAQFGTLLEKTQRRFHPDRWRSRGLIATVLDERLREVMELAVNIVSQATNELVSNWRAGKLV
jgi:hypothetical protein